MKKNVVKWHERNGEVQINIIFELNEMLTGERYRWVWARPAPQEYAYHIKMDVLQSIALKSLSTYNLICSRDSFTSIFTLEWNERESEKNMQHEKNDKTKRTVDYLPSCILLHSRVFTVYSKLVVLLWEKSRAVKFKPTEVAIFKFSIA